MNQYDNVSEADFVKWQEERQEMKRKLAAMTYNYHHAREEAAHWQKDRQEKEDLTRSLITRVRELEEERAYWERIAQASLRSSHG